VRVGDFVEFPKCSYDLTKILDVNIAMMLDRLKIAETEDLALDLVDSYSLSLVGANSNIDLRHFKEECIGFVILEDTLL
jgi:hypothetical protein